MQPSVVLKAQSSIMASSSSSSSGSQGDAGVSDPTFQLLEDVLVPAQAPSWTSKGLFR